MGTPLALAAGMAAAFLFGTPRLAAAAEDGPIKIAVFDLELRDTSAGSGIIAQDAADTENLKKATAEVRRLLAASGRYSIVDTAGALGEAAAAQGIQYCNGCEAALARRFGADQSMAGVVTRMARIIFTVQVVVRDAKTGAIVSHHFTDRRMGANDSWPRGVTQLMESSVLAPQR